LIPKALTKPDDMNLDDETLLSAYLDDELDPADRLAVEWSIESNPPLAEQFRSIVQARAAVSRLSRPEIPRDLAPELGARLLANRRRDRLRKLAQPARVVAAFTGFATIAASLIFAIILVNHSLHESPRPAAIVADQPAPDLRPHLPIADSILPQPTIPQEPVSNDPVLVPQVAVKAAPTNTGSLDDKRELDARRVIAGMLEQSHVRRIRIVTDVIDASDKVKNLIHQDGRMNPDFGRISICQEIVIDPDCPEAVEVFAVPMDERDRRAFVGQLAKAFPKLVEEAEETSPDLVMQLTEVGQVALFRGTEAAPLVDPPHDLRPFIANRAEIPQIHIVETDPRPAGPGRSEDSSNDRKVEAPKGPVVAGPAPTLKSSNEFKPGDRVTVLVWVVTRPARHL
jgi:hypothetical protein